MWNKRKNGNKIIYEVFATYHDGNLNNDNNKLNAYYSLYKKINNNIKLIEITDINDKKWDCN